jgi:hypothetical protein
MRENPENGYQEPSEKNREEEGRKGGRHKKAALTSRM